MAERRRLAALHQQRVLAHLAQRRRTALACYTRSLRDTPPNVISFIICFPIYHRLLHGPTVTILGCHAEIPGLGEILV